MASGSSSPRDRALSKEEAIGHAASFMTDFAERTGLSSDRPKRRYLWTDAFAVCNFLGLARATGQRHYTDLALLLVDQVHRVLGRHRADDLRTGWLSGLGETEGAAHPTSGGLRIGKNLPERRPGEPLDTELEWDRDGQYFHYLTKWMHALASVSLATCDARFNLWARELARTAHASFVKRSGPRRDDVRMHWKMSIDLSRPLVPSMGQHDPLDGLVTFAELEMTSRRHRASPTPDLAPAIAEFAVMVEATDLRTADPLGLGGLLSDAWRVAQLGDSGSLDGTRLLEKLLRAAAIGLSRYATSGEHEQPPSRRLAFRELGLAIGLRAVELIEPLRGVDPRRMSRAGEGIEQLLVLLGSYSGFGNRISSFWLDPEHRTGGPWADHLDINEVMLATSLVPEGYLRPGD